MTVYRPTPLADTSPPRAFGGPTAARTFGDQASDLGNSSRTFGAGGRSNVAGSAELAPRSVSANLYTYRGHAYRPFLAAHYDWPPGQFYVRYRLGMYLPPLFWLPNYLILDYFDYGLVDPPADCEWVRFGPDLLLISLPTGQVVDVVYGAFIERLPVSHLSAPHS